MPGTVPFVVPNGGFIPTPNGGGGGGAPDGILSIQAAGGIATGPLVSFANSNNISFGIAGNTVTASVVPDAGIGLAVPGTTIATGTVVLSNSNGISFGLNGSTVTGSVAAGATATGNFGGLGAGTQTATSGTVVMANSNGITFGMSGSSQITASVSREPSIAAGTQTGSSGTIVFSNSNGVTFGMSNSSVVTASYSQSTGPNAIAVNAAGSITAGTAVFSNSNNITFGLNGSTVTASASFPAQVAFGISAGTQSVSTGTLVFSDSNGLSFGMSGSSRITMSVSREPVIAINAAGSITAGTAVFSNSNNVTFGLNGSTVTASASYSQSTGPNAIAVNAAGSITAGTAVFSNSNNVSFGINGSTITATVTVPAETPFGISAGTQSVSTGTMVFSNSNNFTFGMSGSSRITVSYVAPQAIAVNAAGSVSNGTAVFSNSNNVTFGINGSTITASAGGGANVSFFENQLPAASSNLAAIIGSMQIQRLVIPVGVSVTRLEFMRRTNAGSVSLYPRIYTMNGSTASVLFSSSALWSSFNPGDVMTVSSFAVGTWSLTPGDYMFGLGASGAADGIRLVAGFIGPFNEVTGGYFRDGLLTAISADSFQVSQIQSLTAGSGRPYVRMLGTF